MTRAPTIEELDESASLAYLQESFDSGDVHVPEALARLFPGRFRHIQGRGYIGSPAAVAKARREAREAFGFPEPFCERFKL